MSARWIRRLIHAGLEPGSRPGLDGLAQVIGQATGASGVVFWTRIRADEDAGPCVIAAWLADGPFGRNGFWPQPDPATLAVLDGRPAPPSLEPARRLRISRDESRPVAAAAPVAWTDGGRGAVTLLGDGQLSKRASATLEDLIDVLPAVCEMVRNRQMLALSRVCNEILRTSSAPIEPTKPIEHIGETEPVDAQGPAEHEQFTLAMRRVCQEISTENRSWRGLASGITQLNEQIRAQLGSRRPQREPVYHAAFEVIQRVVPDCDAATVRVGEPGEPDALFVSSADGTVPGHEAPRPRADGWVVGAPIQVSKAAHGWLEAIGHGGAPPPNSAQVCQIIADQLGLHHFLWQTLKTLRDTQNTLERTMTSQAMALEDIKHQLVSPLVAATMKTEGVLHRGRIDSQTDVSLRAVRGLCRRAGRVALSAGVFSVLSRDQLPRPKPELLGFDELLRMLILSADDAQVLIDPRRAIRIEVERTSFRSMGRRLLQADRSFLEQCLGNLVDNAAKYSYDGTTIAITGDVTEAALAIRVANLGIPLPRRDIERCRQRNWRGRAAKAATGEGSGLGLWIADKLTRAMNGAVEITAVGDATTVSLRLPLA